MRKSISLDSSDAAFEEKLRQWATQHEVCCILQSNSEQQGQPNGTRPSIDGYSSFELCIAVGVADQILDAAHAFESLRKFHQSTNDWLFGFLTYDLKNEIEDLHSKNTDELKFPSIHFFQPKWIFIKDQSGFRLEYLESPDDIIDQITNFHPEHSENFYQLQIQSRITKEQYITGVTEIKKHIHAGDIFEMNYCMEFFSHQSLSNPYALYEKLNEISPMPFSCFYKMKDQYLLCASPERFLAKRGNKLISQPIKGTARRGKTDAEDAAIKEVLLKDKKEKAENVMIVDLVRNDLARTAKAASVHVESLSELHTFKSVHHLISTVVSELSGEHHWTEAIKLAFPMGSMTGAPKVRAMQIIEQYEKTKRGLYSGSVGYITPEGDFDFNVVIRSILYNNSNSYLSFMAGSAITSNCDAEKEYEECMLKAATMRDALKTPVTV